MSESQKDALTNGYPLTSLNRRDSRSPGFRKWSDPVKYEISRPREGHFKYYHMGEQYISKDVTIEESGELELDIPSGLHFNKDLANYSRRQEGARISPVNVKKFYADS